MTFPGAGAHVYYNDAGEPLGWDYPSDDPHNSYESDDRDWCEQHQRMEDSETHELARLDEYESEDT